MKSLTGEIVDFATGLTFSDLPESGVLAIKRALLDCIGCALGAYVTPKPEVVLGHIKELGGNPQASIIGDGKTSWALASFANAELICCLAFENGGPPGGSHSPPYVIPPSLAIAERVKASGKEFITALALGYEINSRLGRSVVQFKRLKGEPPYYEYLPMESINFNTFGAVAGASKLLGLDKQKTAWAYGIAGSSTIVPAAAKWRFTPQQFWHGQHVGTWAGWVAKLATEAALLAERGFIGDTTVLDGEWGFGRICGSPYFNSDTFLDLGKVWYHSEMSKFKRYPIVATLDGAVDIFNQMLTENEIKPEEIEQIVVKTDPAQLQPHKNMTEITNFFDTQYATAYIFAVAAFHGRKPGAYWQASSTYKDPRIVSLMKKVKAELHHQTEEILAAEFKAGKHWNIVIKPCIVEITARGKKFTKNAVTGPDAPPPMTDEQLKQKFMDNASYSRLTSDKVERLIEAIYDLENIDDITEISLTS